MPITKSDRELLRATLPPLLALGLVAVMTRQLSGVDPVHPPRDPAGGHASRAAAVRP